MGWFKFIHSFIKFEGVYNYRYSPELVFIEILFQILFDKFILEWSDFTIGIIKFLLNLVTIFVRFV